VKRDGFSLIEALVALTVAAMVLLAVLELQHQIADGEAHYERALALAGVQRNAMALTEDINPAEKPAGEIPMAGGRILRWTSTPVTGFRRNVAYPAGNGRFEVRLYRLRVDLYDGQRRPLGTLSFDRVGWRPVDTLPPSVKPRS